MVKGLRFVTIRSLVEGAGVVLEAPEVHDCGPTTLVPDIVPPQHGDAFILVTTVTPGATVREFGFSAGIEEIGSATSTVVALTRPLKVGETIIARLAALVSGDARVLHRRGGQRLNSAVVGATTKIELSGHRRGTPGLP